MESNYPDNSTANNITLADNNVLSTSQAILFYGLSIIIPFGLIFNTMSVVVFMSRPLRKRSASWYLAALGISDDISLITVLLDYWMKDKRIGWAPTHQSEALCIIVTYLSYFSRLYSAIIVISFTVERFIGVVFPLKRATLRTTSHVRKVLALEAPFCLLATSFTFFTIGIVQDTGMGSEAGTGTQCDIKRDYAYYYGVFSVVVLIFGSIIIPVIVICSLNAFMFRRIWLRKKNFHSHDMTFSGNKPVTKRKNRYNTATLLLAVSTIFVILNLPYCITWIMLYIHYHVQSLGDGNYHKLYAAKYITTVQYYLNFGINFLVYNICARMFRVEFLRASCFLYRLANGRAELKRSSTKKTSEYSAQSMNETVSNGLWHNLKDLTRKGCGYSCPAQHPSISDTF